MKQRGVRRTVVGEVVRCSMNKTIVVQADRLAEHPRYHKYVRKVTTFKAHDENNEARVGAKVRIVETRPLSKTKHWRVAEVLQQGKEEQV